MDENTSKVYVLADEQGRITCCEGGYTSGNIKDPENWVQIDEGYGDKYNLCQFHYFEDGLYTEDGLPRYKLEDGKAVERTDEEIGADRAALPEPEPSENEKLRQRVTELEHQILTMRLGGI